MKGAGSGWYFDAGDHLAALAWLPDGEAIAAGPVEGGISLLDRRTGEVRRVLRGHAFGNCALSVSASDGVLASGGQDGVVRIWRTDTGALAHEL